MEETAERRGVPVSPEEPGTTRVTERNRTVTIRNSQKLCRQGSRKIPCATPARMLHRHNRRIGIIAVENLRKAAAGDRPAQQVLAGPGVLVGEEPAIDQQPRVIIDDEEQPGPDRAL